MQEKLITAGASPLADDVDISTSDDALAFVR